MSDRVWDLGEAMRIMPLVVEAIRALQGLCPLTDEEREQVRDLEELVEEIRRSMALQFGDRFR